MDALWLLVAMWIGFLAGFFLFALMSMARDRPAPARQTHLPLHWPRAHN